MTVPAEVIPPGVVTAEERFDAHWEQWGALHRRSVDHAWECGRALRELKSSFEHGEFQSFLSSRHVSTTTANRLMQLASYEKAQVGLLARWTPP